MGSMKEHPRYNVVSLRISDEEREALEDFVQKTNRSVSQLMREAMELLMFKMEKSEGPERVERTRSGSVHRC